jgi:hypothetical protein
MREVEERESDWFSAAIVPAAGLTGGRGARIRRRPAKRSQGCREILREAPGDLEGTVSGMISERLACGISIFFFQAVGG